MYNRPNLQQETVLTFILQAQEAKMILNKTICNTVSAKGNLENPFRAIKTSLVNRHVLGPFSNLQEVRVLRYSKDKLWM